MLLSRKRSGSAGGAAAAKNFIWLQKINFCIDFNKQKGFEFFDPSLITEKSIKSIKTLTFLLKKLQKVLKMFQNPFFYIFLFYKINYKKLQKITK